MRKFAGTTERGLVFIQLSLMRREKDYHWPGSPLERERGKKRKQKTTAPHVVLPLTTPADFKHKGGGTRESEGEKKK